MSTEDGTRHLSAVPGPGSPSTPKPTPPKGGAFPSNPLLNFLHGPDPDGVCPACRWVKAHLGHEPCPHHAAWQAIVVRVVDRVGDADDEAPLVYPTEQPAYRLHDRVWFQGKLQVKITQRYLGRGDGRWRYIAKTLPGGTAIDTHEDFLTREFDAAWAAPQPATRRSGS
ncbi:hypothetical protein [Amycolatopsis eburnea]|uniref:Uncharacterized protein n=1 Tax=Amycolatopsis eburnea TaxID=2267691 RepID=A0A427TQ41_9PSEU|nr:hypothetical protein [Amycolatopsis eburnea]RSD26377.1 hypothetical protein EIY87_00500 [Amycolatopsis eburnea]